MSSEPGVPDDRHSWAEAAEADFAALQDRVDAGFVPDEALDELVKGVERVCDDAGWDQPARVFSLMSTNAVPGPLADAMLDEPFGMSAVVAAHVRDVLGNPSEDLVGMVVPPRTLGLVLVSETWSFPPDVTSAESDLYKPSEHPRRVEARDAILVTADGRQCWCRRVRGANEAVVNHTVVLRGPLVNVLRAAMRLNPDEKAPDAAEVVCSSIAVLAFISTVPTSPVSDPAFVVASALHAMQEVADDHWHVETSEEPGWAVADEIVAAFAGRAQKAWESTGDWVDDSVLSMFLRAHPQLLVRPLARMLLGMSEEDVSWWPAEHLALQLARSGASLGALLEKNLAETQAGAAVHALVVSRLERLAELRQV